MSTLFIADLHLDDRHPEMIQTFLHLLQTQQGQVDALYILGDFFEVWLGADACAPWHTALFEAMKTFAAVTPTYFMQGNRDFLVTPAFCNSLGITFLPDPTTIDLYGTPTVITHGDLLCTDDVAYQRFRSVMHTRCLQWLFLRLPAKLRRNIAGRLRAGSKKHTRTTSAAKMDVTHEAVMSMMLTYNVNQMIHGHTHKPNIHTFTEDKRTYTRAVLGAWHNQGSVLIATPNAPLRLETVQDA